MLQEEAQGHPHLHSEFLGSETWYLRIAVSPGTIHSTVHTRIPVLPAHLYRGPGGSSLAPCHHIAAAGISDGTPRAQRFDTSVSGWKWANVALQTLHAHLDGVRISWLFLVIQTSCVR